MKLRFYSSAGAILPNPFFRLGVVSWRVFLLTLIDDDQRETEKIRIFRRKLFWVVVVVIDRSGQSELGMFDKRGQDVWTRQNKK